MKWLKLSLLIFFAIILICFFMMQTVRTSSELEKPEYPEVGCNLN